MRNKITYAVILIYLLSTLTGCVSLYGRKTFAQKALEGTKPILSEYRLYISNDPNLNSEEKNIRLRTADELENFLKEGAR